MNLQWWQQLLLLVGTLAGSYLTFLATRKNKRSDVGQQMIDQHQEDIKELRAGRTEDRARIGTLERQVRAQGDYIGVLRRHIADGHPPPPPPYPDGLIT